MLLLVGALLAGCGAGAPPVPAPAVGTVPVWFDQTARAVQEQGGVPDPVATRTWALAWWAADRACDALTPGTPGPAGDAAVATAVHDVLGALVPGRRDALDQALAGAAADRGAAAAAGRREAAAVLRGRAGDGLSVAEVNRPVVLPPPSPGTYRPTPPGLTPPQQGGQGDARPFLLTSSAEVDPGPPAPLGSAAYARDLAEVRRLGERTSTARTQAQTDLARLYAPSLVGLLTPAVRTAVVGLDACRAAGVLSDLHRISLDAQLVAYRAKYAYLRWRPVTAIGGGWTPLVDTPPQPEYPAGHTVYAAALAAVLEREVGPVAFELRGGDAPQRYTDWQQVVQDNVDARVWAGVHLRGSDEAGAALGRAVAKLALARLAG